MRPSPRTPRKPSPGRPRPAAALAVAAALAACGYHFTQRYTAMGGVNRIYVRPFVNTSTEPELGAVVTTSLRDELARRGADAGEGAGAVLDGEVRATQPVVTSTAITTWHIAVEVRARLVAGSSPPVERMVRKEIDFLADTDPLATEGRRALAVRQLADQAAHELLHALER